MNEQRYDLARYTYNDDSGYETGVQCFATGLTAAEVTEYLRKSGNRDRYLVYHLDGTEDKFGLPGYDEIINGDEWPMPNNPYKTAYDLNPDLSDDNSHYWRMRAYDAATPALRKVYEARCRFMHEVGSWRTGPTFNVYD